MLNVVDDIKPADNSATTTIHVSPPVLALAATSVASSHFLPSTHMSVAREVGQK
jgi:hypothetical protein